MAMQEQRNNDVVRRNAAALSIAKRRTSVRGGCAAILAAVALGCGGQAELADYEAGVEPNSTLSGQLLLPPGDGSRGVELVITVREVGSAPQQEWVLFDEQGYFESPLRGRFESLSVSTGLRAELYLVSSDERLERDSAGRRDVGSIDLRQALTPFRLRLRAAEDAPPGDVRVALCFGPPPVGPQGEPIALGSRQFPPVTLGREIDWLLPHNRDDIYFLVERPAASSTRDIWRSGRQQLFGPFDTSALPTELSID